MNEYIKPCGWRRDFDYVKENFIIMFKVLKEYKANLIGAILQKIIEQIVYLLIFFSIINISLGDVINWSYTDFLIFGLFVALVEDISGLFVWKDSIFKQILSGEINQYLVRPMKVVFAYYFRNMTGQAIISLIIDFIVIYFVSLYFNIVYYNLLIVFIVLFLLITLRIFMHSLNNSIAFFNYGLMNILYDIRVNFNEITSIYPSDFFSSFKSEWLFYPFSFYYIGALVLPLIKNTLNINVLFNISILLLINVIIGIISLILWHYGLKKYEAYG